MLDKLNENIYNKKGGEVKKKKNTRRVSIIRKRNEMTRGGDNLSLHAKRALNTIYYLLQGHQEHLNYEYVSISFSALRKYMRLEKNERYVAIIKEALQELRQPIELHNFYHPLLDKVFEWYSLSLIDEAGFPRHGKERVAIVKLNEMLKDLISKKIKQGNYTPLDLSIINSFRNPHASKVYEFLKSFEQYRYIDITQEYLLRILGLSETKTYQNYADLKRLLKRQIKEIKNKSDLKDITLMEGKDFAKQKIFRIIISNKGQRTPTQFNIRAAVDEIVNRFKI